jgi:hypothetical protein
MLKIIIIIIIISNNKDLSKIIVNFKNILFVKMRILLLIDYLTYMCWSHQGTTITNLRSKCVWR